MKKKLFFLFAVVLIFVSVSFSYTSSTAKQSESMRMIPDTADTQAAIKTIEKSYEIEREVLYTNDFSKFPTVFINDSRFNLEPADLQTVRELTNNPSLKSAGFLDYKMAYWSWRVSGALRLEALLAKAKSENRGLTEAEKASLVDSYGRVAPARPPKDKIKQKEIPLQFISVNIDGDIAIAVLDNGPTTIQLSLVLVNKKWYIAAYRTISIHP